MGDDDDPLAQHLELISKRVEKIVQGKLQYLGDQLYTAVNDIEELRRKLTHYETMMNLQVQNNLYLMRTVNLLVQELDHLEVYLSKNDPELKRLLLECLEKQRQELTKRDLRNERG